MMHCVYDNPKTFCREYWEDGELIGFATAETVIAINRFEERIPWQPGKILRGNAMALKILDQTTHERKVSVHLDETELRDILSKFVADQVGLKLNRNTQILLTVGHNQKSGPIGFEPWAEITLTHNYDEVQPSD